MRHVRLISFTDEMTGSTGLKIKGSDGERVFADRTGGLIAHDLIDHQNGPAAIGCPADELEALGAIWHVRGRNGTLLMDNDFGRCIYEAMANDVAACVDDVDGMGWYPGTVRYQTHTHDYDEDFIEIIDKAIPIARRNNYHDSAEGDDPFPFEQFAADALHLLRRGFNKSRRRWGMSNHAAETYLAVKEAVRPFASSVHRTELEGIEFRLSYGRGEAKVRPIHKGDEW